MKVNKFLSTLAIMITLFPYNANSQSNTASATQDIFDIGYAVYTKGATPGTLNAIWNYANVYSGKGKATGVSKEGFAGNYHIRYYYENGEFSDEYDLVIEKTGKFYNLSWITNGKVSARGVGTVIDDRLLAGWRRVTDNQNSKTNPTNTEPANIKEITVPKYIVANQALHDTIVALDKLYWEAYNKGDSTTLFNLMADDHEFYHDIGGPTFSKEKMKVRLKNFINQDEGVVGKTVEGTIEVYEMPDYGALQLSYRRFYDKKNPEWTAPARAIVLWKKTPHGWLRSRVFSLHQNPKKP